MNGKLEFSWEKEHRALCYRSEHKQTILFNYNRNRSYDSYPEYVYLIHFASSAINSIYSSAASNDSHRSKTQHISVTAPSIANRKQPKQLTVEKRNAVIVNAARPPHTYLQTMSHTITHASHHTRTLHNTNTTQHKHNTNTNEYKHAVDGHLASNRCIRSHCGSSEKENG